VKTKKIFPVFLLLLLLGGCSHNKMEAEAAFSLGDALTAARERCPGDIYNCYSYWNDLEKLWDHAEGDEKELIEHEMLKYLLKRLESHYDPQGRTSAALRSLRQKSMNDNIRNAAGEALLGYQQDLQESKQAEETEFKQKQEEEQKQAEGIRAEFRESRDRLIRIGAGSLRDKSAEEIKKLVDGWTPQKGDPTQYYWFILEFLPNLNDEELREYFSADVFYKVFGQPQRKQFINSDGVYYFYYDCKDGLVQIEVPAELLSEKNVVLVSDFNIF
jgi:hypothetical protein